MGTALLVGLCHNCPFTYVTSTDYVTSKNVSAQIFCIEGGTAVIVTYDDKLVQGFVGKW